jgi:mannose-6-phosphate isomerase-like protein (cupin superfamily)
MSVTHSIGRAVVVATMVATGSLLAAPSLAFAQASPPRRTCLPVSERAGRDAGCWLLASESLGIVSEPAVYWHLDTYETRVAAETAKGPRGTVVEAVGKIWLFTVANAGWRSPGGVRIAEIGPLFVKSGEQYTALYAEGISNVGDVTPVHHHPAPEAWYTTAGEMCVETPAGKMVGRAGETNIIPANTPVTILATGKEQRRSVWLVLHESAHPWTSPVNWMPKGLCKNWYR